MGKGLKRVVKDAIKIITPTRLYLEYYANKHDDEYKRLMDEVGAPEYYKTREVKRDYFKSLAYYGFPVKHYKEFGFYEIKDKKVRESFLAPLKLMSLWQGVNCGESRGILDNKVKFLECFSEYLGRDWIYAPDSTYQDFKEFCLKHHKMLVKKPYGSGGEGIHLFNYDDHTDGELEVVYKDLVDQDALIEEFVNQTGLLHEINPSSVNCIRICTMRFKDHVEVFQCFLKVGVGDVCVDNTCQGGIIAPVDADTGIVNGVPKNKEWSEFKIHPVSGIKVEGIQIPYWEEIKRVVIEASEKVKDIIYVSWDVAVSDDGKIYLIEGNSCGYAMVLKEGGEWPVFERAMKEHHKILHYKYAYNYLLKMRIRNIMAIMDY